MKLLDKLKNALFEEEYVEVEEKPVRKEKPKEKPIAKKIVLPKEDEEKKEEEPPKKEFVFPLMEEEDFIDLTEQEQEEKEVYPKKEERRPKKQVEVEAEKEEEERLEPYTGGKKKEKEIPMYEYGYERKTVKKEFTPSPIISPIYGILDKNYKKEDVVSKREVRLSYPTSNRMDLDAVRAKAYGDMDDHVFEEELEKEQEEVEPTEKEEEKIFLDISEEQTPTVPKVTVGDAEEYFEDLGLEYNIDYKDASKEKASGRRTKDSSSLDEDDAKAHEEESETEEENLFDLIDSMYEEKDGE